MCCCCCCNFCKKSHYIIVVVVVCVTTIILMLRCSFDFVARNCSSFSGVMIATVMLWQRLRQGEEPWSRKYKCDRWVVIVLGGKVGKVERND